ncbi:hypothetical protein ES703_42453 [subsurface metagenome]
MRKIIVIICLLVAARTGTGALWYSSGYNTFDDSDPYHAEVWVINDAVLDVFGGEMGKLEFQDNSSGNIYASEMDWLWTDDNAVVNIYAATFNMLASRPESTVYLYAYDVVYHSDGGYNDHPWLEGKYISGDTPFSFNFYYESSVPQLHVVPEPATLILLALGALVTRNQLHKASNYNIIESR